ncbi:hypothetical protein MASR1M45_12500 [Candidatus Kapaibacterium sp.]
MPYKKKNKEEYDDEKFLSTNEKYKLKQERYHQKKDLIPPEWERQEEETLQSWEAFKLFRDMGITRTMSAVARQLSTPDKYRGKYQVVQNWSYKWRWTERIIAYQKYLDAIYLEETKKNVKEMATRHAEYAKNTMQSVYVPVMEFIRKYSKIENLKKNPLLSDSDLKAISESDIEKMTLSQLMNLVYKSAPLMSVLADMERKSRGEPTNISSSDITTGGEQLKPDIKIVVNGSQSTILKEYENNL